MQVYERATPAQKGFLADLIARKGYAAQVALDTLTKPQASQLIDHLKRLPNATATAPTSYPPLPTIPEGRYAITGADGTTDFYKVDHGKDGTRWEGRTFVTLLTGSPGGFARTPITGKAKATILRRIEADGPEAACQRFGRELGICGVCGSPLTNPDSIALGIGPECRKRF